MKVFLTGASGFVGTQLISFLTRCHGDSVVALSRSENADHKIKKAIKEVPTKGWREDGGRPDVGSVDIVRGDLTSVEKLREGMQGCDTVIHAAAKIDDWGEYSEFQKATVDGTRNVVEAAKAAGVSKFVHVSTEAVLVKATTPIGEADETTPVDPPLWAPYSRSKAEAEKIVVAANSPPDFETIIIRPRFIWGRGDTVCRPSLTQAFNEGFRWATPLAKSSTTHVINVCHALRLAATAEGKGGETYFVTDGPAHLLKDFLLRYICSQPGVKVKEPTGTIPFWALWAYESTMESLPFYGYGVKRKPLVGRQMLRLICQDVVIKDAKIRRELGYKEIVGIEEGIEDANRAQVNE